MQNIMSIVVYDEKILEFFLNYVVVHCMVSEYFSSVKQPIFIFRCMYIYDVTKGIRRCQRGRQKSLSRKTDKTMANKMKRKTQNTTLKTKLNNILHFNIPIIF